VSCGNQEHEADLTIPPVVRIAVVRVQPTTIVIAVDAEHVQVAIRIGYV